MLLQHNTKNHSKLQKKRTFSKNEINEHKTPVHFPKGIKFIFIVSTDRFTLFKVSIKLKYQKSTLHSSTTFEKEFSL